jgi:anti-sigma B factor antagonist
MASDNSRLRITEKDGITRVDFVDRDILDEANIRQIGSELLRLVESKPEPKMLLCFRNVEHLSSAALGTLITLHSTVKKKSGQLRMSDIRPQIFEVFVITKLNKLFTIDDTGEQSMGRFSV